MPLARHVPPDIPLYGLQTPGLDGTAEPPRSVRQMAATYLHHIRAVQPSGPYHLLGWSFGGLVAHEIAVQLQTAGHHVAALTIMDAYPHAELRPDPTSPDVTTALTSTQDRIRARFAGHLPGTLSEEEYQRLAQISRNNSQLSARHQPGTFHGQALLLTAARNTSGPHQAAERWRPHITGPITTVPLPCAHRDMCQPENLAQVWQAISASDS
jgi:thioesterase domain-containing protein